MRHSRQLDCRLWLVGNSVAGYGMAGKWIAGYGVAGVPVAGNVLPATESLFTMEILVNTSMCCMFW
jgi:hypothetical protein